MSIIIEKPSDYKLTKNWHEIQYTNLHEYHPLNSQETNKLLKAFGRGSFFVVKGFRLSLFKETIDNKETCIARLTPGIYVQDWTVIDYIQLLKETKKYIYIKLFDVTDFPAPGRIFRIGSRYYHGLIGDGIDAKPTYSIFECINENGVKDSFRTFYRLTCNSNYINNTIDLNNITIDDFRFSSSILSDPLDEKDYWAPTIDDDQDNEYNEDVSDSNNSYQESLARSNSIAWSIIFGGH